MCEILDLERSGTKEDIVNKIMTYCEEPRASGKKVPKPKSKSQFITFQWTFFNPYLFNNSLQLLYCHFLLITTNISHFSKVFKKCLLVTGS